MRGSPVTDPGSRPDPARPWRLDVGKPPLGWHTPELSTGKDPAEATPPASSEDGTSGTTQVRRRPIGFSPLTSKPEVRSTTSSISKDMQRALEAADALL